MRQRLDEVITRRARDASTIELVQTSFHERDWLAISQALQSDALRELDRQRQTLTASLANTSGAPAIELRAELARLEQELVAAATGELSTLRRSVNLDQSQETDLRQQLRTTVLSGVLSPELLAGVYELQQSSELARTQYQTLLTRVQDFGAQAALQVADSRIVSPAMPPSGKSFPNTTVSLIIAAIVGLGLGVTLAFVYEHLVGGVQTEEQAEAVLKVPVASAVPRTKGIGEGHAGASLADNMVLAPFSTFAEAVRRIKVVIDQSLQRRRTLTNKPKRMSPS